ncbi:hypothetical protein H7Y40_00335 [Pedobacter sp.]|nr:hypothetical protein [Candidatus Saccharibacteria bacterium]
MEETPHHEFAPDVTMPLRRYFNDCMGSASYAALLMGADTYLETLFGKGEGGGNPLDVVISQGVIVDEIMYDFDERQAREQFLLVPIRLSSLTDLSMTAKEMHDWYQTAVATALGGGIDVLHSKDCLNREDENEGCAHSINCPHKVARSLMLHDIREPDFSSLDYQMFGELKNEIVRIKVYVAQERGLLTAPEANRLVNNYRNLRHEYNTAQK